MLVGTKCNPVSLKNLSYTQGAVQFATLATFQPRVPSISFPHVISQHIVQSMNYLPTYDVDQWK